jgi:hypothetical protein
MVEWLLFTHEALSSNSSSTKKKKTTKQNKLANSSYGYTGFQCAILSTDIFQNKKEVITWKHDKRSDRIWGDAYADYQVDYPMYTWMKTSHYIS